MTTENTVEDNSSTEFRSGFVAVVGKPNVGKSTLMNYLLGEKVAIVSPKPQTTRERQLGILTTEFAQVIFVDTPGIHTAKTKLGKYMVESAFIALSNADLILFLTDSTSMPVDDDRDIAAQIVTVHDVPVVIALNKTDLVSPQALQSIVSAYSELVSNAPVVTISAISGENVPILLSELISRLPLGPQFYPEDQLTETYLRDNVAELIREKILTAFEEEIPHAVAVQVDEYKERSDQLTYIRATIYVEKDSQKGIVIGDKGRMLKQIGAAVRPDVETVVGTSVYLELWVKVLRNWRKDERALKRLGYYHKS